MIRSSVCAYPWDAVGDPAAADRFAAFGADTVALAAAYHSVRAATPRHAAHRVVEAPRSALYLPVREEAWRDRRLRPQAASWAGEDAFGTAREALSASGLEVSAWVVLTHHDQPGASDLRVRSAFGDVLSHALCPSNDDVVEYAATLVAEVAATGVRELMLEAVGPLGFGHLGAHEKTAGADWTPVDEDLLSICTCAACDQDPELAGAIRRAVGSGAESVEEALGDLAGPVLAGRRAATRRMLDAVADAAGGARLTVHAGLDRWGTGSFTTFGPGPLPVDALILSDPAAGALDAEAVAALASGSGAAVGAYVQAMPPQDPDGLAERWQALARAGITEFVIYHGGLLSAARSAAAAAALAAVRG